MCTGEASNALWRGGKKNSLANAGAELAGMAGRELTAHYEELRAQSLAASGRGLGLTLFLREGMCAWVMRVRS